MTENLQAQTQDAKNQQQEEGAIDTSVEAANTATEAQGESATTDAPAAE